MNPLLSPHPRDQIHHNLSTRLQVEVTVENVLRQTLPSLPAEKQGALATEIAGALLTRQNLSLLCHYQPNPLLP